MLKDGPKIYRLARFQLRRVLRCFKYMYSAPCLAWQWKRAIRTQSQPRTPILLKSNLCLNYLIRSDKFCLLFLYAISSVTK